MRRAEPPPVHVGRAHPPGARPEHGGVNFSVFSQHAAAAELLLYDRVDDAEPARVIALDAHRHHTRHCWHVFVPALAPGQIYAWRLHGPSDAVRGHRFDADEVPLDPHGRAVAVPSDYRRDAAWGSGSPTTTPRTGKATRRCAFLSPAP